MAQSLGNQTFKHDKMLYMKQVPTQNVGSLVADHLYIVFSLELIEVAD